MKPLYPLQRTVDHLAVVIHANPVELGRAAAAAAAVHLQEVIAAQGAARVIFGCAPSQDEFFTALTDPDGFGSRIAWPRVTAFHMDEYVGLAADDPTSFRSYLRQHLLERVNLGRFYPISAEGANSEEICAQYSRLVAEQPIDLICLGIGENGHIAFNDPPVADFDDPLLAKVVDLDPICRQQQVNDGCFATIKQVPTRAITLTVPVFLGAGRLTIQVPGHMKAPAVRAALLDPISTACPATVLRTHPSASLHLEPASASLL